MRHECGGDCWHEPVGYPWCHGCGEHHRAPVAEREGERCPVDGALVLDVTEKRLAGVIVVPAELFADAAAVESFREEWTLDIKVGPRHGPWLHQSMPDHLWPDNIWWWLPPEDEDDGGDADD